MTENKRFMIEKSSIVEDGFFICDNTGKFSFPTTKDKSELIMYVKHLNELNNENEQLKQFQTNVFTLISEMIETANLYRTPIKTLDYGDDLGYWNGVYQKLKELRDILENDQTRK